MQNNATTAPALGPAEILEIVTDPGISRMRDYLNTLFTSYVTTKEWEDATDYWKNECATFHRIFNRFFDKAEAWENARMNSPQVER